jgi:hypothetical protein
MRLWLLAVALAGCGYHLAGTGAAVPTEARTISIGAMLNRTRDRGLEVRLRRAIEDEFRRRSQLRVVGDNEGDLVLTGIIKHFTASPVASGATDEAVQYQGSLVVSVHVVERSSGHVVFDSPGITETEDFGAVSGVIITSSPRFQEGTLNARDLAGFTNVQIGDASRRAASQTLLDLVAKDVYQQSMEGF